MSADEAFEAAARLLRHRDRASADLDRRLAERGFADAERAVAIATLTRTGVLDDARFATERARSLAARGAGDRLIRHDLEAAGLGRELVESALDELEPEAERARRIADKRTHSARTVRYLVGKGFSEDAVRVAVARADDEGIG